MLAPLEDLQRREQRKARFLGDSSNAIATTETLLDAPARGVVVGVCTVVEKEYLRLTTAPDPTNVRPLRILKMALKQVKSQWLANHDYKYALSQLKSIRQDITVQHLKGKFVVEVYETHGRVAIEEADLGELRQCLSQLELLYVSGHKTNRCEFWTYKLLDGLITMRGGHTNVDFICFLQRLQAPDVRADPCIEHAQAVRVALAENNYVRFFDLWRSAPRLSGFLLDLLVDPLRVKAYRCMLVAYRPSLPLMMLQEQLGFSEQQGCTRFLKLQDGVMTSPTTIDTKLSLQNLNRAAEARLLSENISPPPPLPVTAPSQIIISPPTAKKKKRKMPLAKPLHATADSPANRVKAVVPTIITIPSSDDSSSDSEGIQQLKKLKKKIKRKKPKLKSELASVKQQLTFTKNALEAAKGNSAMCKTLKKEILRLKKQKLQVKIALQSVKTALTTVS